MTRCKPSGRRHFGTIDDPIAIDSHEAAARETASARRVAMPVTGGNIQAIDFEG